MVHLLLSRRARVLCLHEKKRIQQCAKRKKQEHVPIDVRPLHSLGPASCAVVVPVLLFFLSGVSYANSSSRLPSSSSFRGRERVDFFFILQSRFDLFSSSRKTQTVVVVGLSKMSEDFFVKKKKGGRRRKHNERKKMKKEEAHGMYKHQPYNAPPSVQSIDVGIASNR